MRAQGDSVYLGWGGAKAGRGLLACDLEGNVRWKHKYGGFGGAELLAVEGDLVYVGNSSGSPQVLFRLDTARPLSELGQGKQRRVRDLFVKDLWKDQPGMPDKAEAMAVRNGKLYLTFRSYNFRRSDVSDSHNFPQQALGSGRRRRQGDLGEDRQECPRACYSLAGWRRAGRQGASGAQLLHAGRPRRRGRTINGMLNDKTLVDGGAEMISLKLQAAVRRKVEAVFPQEVAVMKSDFVAVLDAQTGKVLKTIPVPAPAGSPP